MSSRDHFQGKRIAVIGLGPHGNMVSDVKFLIKAGALVSVYDLRSETRLKSHLIFLRSVGLANYVCGSIPPDDLLDMDLIILSHEYPRDSSFLKAAAGNGIEVEYPETLLFKLAPPVTVVGVMGPCGKSTVVSMLAPMLEAAAAAHEGIDSFVIDPESDLGSLAHLREIRSGHIVLVRMTAGIMKELDRMAFSPHVAIFTGIPEKGSYEKSPFEILSRQTHNNFIIGSDALVDATYSHGFQPKAKMFRTKASFVPASWAFAGSAHDREHAALALQAARIFKVSDAAAKSVLSSWKPLKGRLELIKKVKGVEFYNDTASISPYSTQLALESLAEHKNGILIFGGVGGPADYRTLYAVLPRFVHTLILIPGSGTLRERRELEKVESVDMRSAPSIEEAARRARDCARKGDRVVFSPGFEAGGFDRSRKERGERFVRAVRAL